LESRVRGTELWRKGLVGVIQIRRPQGGKGRGEELKRINNKKRILSNYISNWERGAQADRSSKPPQKRGKLPQILKLDFEKGKINSKSHSGSYREIKKGHARKQPVA